jgi:acyl-CoA thioester hydrolase
MAVRRKRGGYFRESAGAPDPLVVRVKRRVSFNEADVMGIAWYGRYAVFFEEASAELGRLCGLSYRDLAEANLRAPIVQFHVDYHQPLALDEEFTIMASLVWTRGARLNIEYSIIKEDEGVAATGYSVQMLVENISGKTLLTPVDLLERCRRRWKAGELSWLK